MVPVLVLVVLVVAAEATVMSICSSKSYATLHTLGHLNGLKSHNLKQSMGEKKWRKNRRKKVDAALQQWCLGDGEEKSFMKEMSLSRSAAWQICAHA